MYDLKFKVEKQELKRTDSYVVANKSRNYITASFEFSDEAVMELEKRAVFTIPSGVSFMCILDDDGACVIPDEVLAGEYFFVSVAMGDLLTTNALRVSMEYSNYTTNIHGSSSTDDVFTFVISELSSKAELDHQHIIEDVTNLSVVLNGKSDIGHGHSTGDVNGLNSALQGKADSIHSHNKADITDFNHGHTINEITGLAEALELGLKIEKYNSLNDILEPKASVLYFIPSGNSKQANVFDEYIYINGGFEVIGTTTTDLSNYVRKETGKGLSSNDFTDALLTKLSQGYSKAEIDNLIGGIEEDMLQ